MKIPILIDIENYFKKKRRAKRFLAVKERQGELFNENFKDSKKLIVFVNFANNDFCGGVMTIFYYAKISRQMKAIHGCDVLHACFFNHEGRYYISQNEFKNDEIIYNMELVMEKAKTLDKLILHVPELLMEDLAKELENYKDVLKNIPDFQINVLNQNIDVFSPKETWQSLFEITDNITQTTGFDRYSTQEVCNDWGIPVYPMPAFHDMLNPDNCERKSFKQKEKIIVYSLDQKPLKETIVKNITEKFPDFEVKQIYGLKYSEYLDLIGKAMFSITFGEGYDGYFIEPTMYGSLGVTVYNERFFPSPDFKDYPVVFDSYEELNEKIVDLFNYYIQNPDEYDELSYKLSQHFKKYNYHPEYTIEGMKKLYLRQPAFVPEKRSNV